MSSIMQVMGKSKKGGKSPLGEKIAILTKERGFDKPSDFAHEHGLNLRTFNDLIYGYTKIMPDSLIKVAEKLGVQPWQLLVPMSEQSESVNHLPEPPLSSFNTMVGTQGSHKNANKTDISSPGFPSIKTENSNNSLSYQAATARMESKIDHLPHILSSAIAAEVVTRLRSEPEAMRAAHNLTKPVSETKQKLIDLILGLSDQEAASWLKQMTIGGTGRSLIDESNKPDRGGGRRRG